MCFEEWEKVTKPIEESLKGTVWILTIGLAIAIHHLDESSFREWSNYDIEKK